MLGDITALTKLIKRIAVDVMKAEKPVEICFGKVISAAPLKINVDQKMTLEAPQLILSRSVTDYKTFITAGNTKDFYYTRGSPDSDTAPVDPPHVHAIGKIEITVHNGLAVGEDVILLRQQGGQKYLVWDRLA